MLFRAFWLPCLLGVVLLVEAIVTADQKNSHHENYLIEIRNITEHHEVLASSSEEHQPDEDHVVRGVGVFDDEEEHGYSEEDGGDSDVSEERNPDDFVNTDLRAVKLEGDHDRPEEAVSVISSAFTNNCPKTKVDFLTGHSTADLSPEDIGIIAAMGDSLATGTGLWPRTDIEFRGAAFPIGGDATIDGLITIPNILREFVGEANLRGVSHGMGGREQLPQNQLNVAQSGATSASMPEQARELVRRIKKLREVDVYNTWAMVIITIGTEEICANCTLPDTDALIHTIDILNRGIHRAFVILLGPIHVSSSYHQKANLLKTRCSCSKDKSNEFVMGLSDDWAKAFQKVQNYADYLGRQHFGLLTLPMLTITSRYPYSLFIPNRPLLNRRGHNYATKWLWNRLIAGPKYNLSNAILSQDDYFCPSVGCPYFRTPANAAYCPLLRHADALQLAAERTAARESQRLEPYATALAVVGIALFTVLVLGFLFYSRSKAGTRRRFDAPQVPDGLVEKPRAPTVRRQSTASTTSETLQEVAEEKKSLREPSVRPASVLPFDVSLQSLHKLLT